jgi:D-glycero-D-manno-heptose 1,7-bisphosphate phosphatase
VGIRQAVILAGGEGTRLRPLTDDVPKPMAPVNNRPFLEYLMEMLRENGVSEVVLLLGYLSDKIIQHFGDGSNYGIDIKYSVGKVTDKTGTRIKNAGPVLDDIFLLMYCDNYWPLNLKKLLDFYIEHETLASTTVYANKDGKGEYGAENNICVDDAGYVLKYDKSRKSQDLNGVDIGFFIINKGVLGLMPDHDFSFEEETLPLLVNRRQLSGYQTEHGYYYISTLESLKQTERYLQPQKVVFLDRDGVINRKPADEDYVKNWSEFHFLSGVIEALRLLTQKGYDIYVITNQRGIARGLMHEHDLKVIHDKLKEELEKHGAKIKQIYYCPHGRDYGCECRKPKPGLLFRAASEYDINLTKAVFIGDNESDIQAGNAAGCKTVLVTPEKNLLKIVGSMLNP